MKTYIIPKVVPILNCYVYLSHRFVGTYFGISMLKIASGAEQREK